MDCFYMPGGGDGERTAPRHRATKLGDALKDFLSEVTDDILDKYTFYNIC